MTMVPCTNIGTLQAAMEEFANLPWQFPLAHGMLRTPYAAQGLTLKGGVIIDLRRAGKLENTILLGT